VSHPPALSGLLAALALCLSIAHSRPASAQLFERATVVENVRLRVSDDEVVEGARIVIQGGRISALGSGVEKPFLARTIDGGGGTVTAGLVAVSSSLALDPSRGGGPTSRAWDGFDRYDRDEILEALAGGVTTVCLVPAGRPGILGTAAVVRLAPQENGGHGELVRADAALCLDLGSAQAPLARLRTFQGIRKLFLEAKDHRGALELYEEELAEYAAALAKSAKEAGNTPAEEKKEGTGSEGGGKEPPPRRALAPAAAEPDRALADEPPAGGTPPAPAAEAKPGEKKEDAPKKPEPPPRRPDLEVILRAIDRELPVRIDARRSADILNALELANEYDLDLVIAGGSEAHLVLPALVGAEAAVLIEPAAGGESAENGPERRRPADLAARLVRAGIRIGLAAGAVPRELWWEAERAAAGGGADATALITRDAARLLGLEGTGRLAAGARADLVLWSADPAVDPAARVRRVLIGGKSAYAAPTEPDGEPAEEPVEKPAPAGRREKL